ncbi:MAG TPA: hypothetical protein VFM53_06735, partial [Anaeromyxobacteraceae bacterium]|nr:hypothetical protein [Anaeromyxobacteraceae bacterium]
EITFGGRGRAIGVSGELLFALEARYRRAFQRLEQLGRHDEAAFVLAELLRSEEEAVAYLERHGRLRQAAALAEGRGLPPGLAIRLWFLAGDESRAIRLARAHRAWTDAVDRLERAGKRDQSAALRLRWADDLAEAGDLAGAVRAALPVTQARRLVERWIELAVSAGGMAGHAVLGSWVALRPEHFATVRDRVMAACADAGPEGHGFRRAVAGGLLCAPSTAEVKALARPLERALLVDAASGQHAPERNAIGKLADDPLLRVDVPSTSAWVDRMRPPAQIALAVPADDHGTRPVHDAAALPGGRLLVALGEGGARLHARDGRELARFDVPAHRLVLSDAGTRALAVGARGEVVSVARIDLEARTMRRLRDVQLDGFASTFDGIAWPVRSQRTVHLLDTLHEGLPTLWSVSELGGWPLALERPVPGLLTFVVVGGDDWEGWAFHDGVLRQRTTLDPGGSGTDPAGLLVAGRVATTTGRSEVRWSAIRIPEDGGAPCLGAIDRQGGASAPIAGATGLLSLVGGARLVAAYRSGDAVEVQWFSPGHEPLGRLRLEGAGHAIARPGGDRITAADDTGRVLVIDAVRGRLLQHHRF